MSDVTALALEIRQVREDAEDLASAFDRRREHRRRACSTCTALTHEDAAAYRQAIARGVLEVGMPFSRRVLGKVVWERFDGISWDDEAEAPVARFTRLFARELAYYRREIAKAKDCGREPPEEWLERVRWLRGRV